MTRRRPWGSITEVVKGKKYVLRWTQNTPKGRKRLTKTVYGTRKQASLELDRIHVEQADDTITPTVAQAWSMWTVPMLEAQREQGKLSGNTWDYYNRVWANHVEPRWGKVPVDQLRAIDLQNWLLTLTKGTARAAVMVLRRIYSNVAALMPLPLNPFAPTVRYIMPTATTARSAEVYALDEARAVLSKLCGSMLEPAFILACFGSCRSGESLAVALDSVHEFRRGDAVVAAVEICQQMPQTATEPARELKNAQSHRVVCIPPEVAPRLLEIAEERREFGTKWLCDRGDGTPMDRNACMTRWRRFCKREGVRYIPWANLRNSWRTIAETEAKLPWELAEMLMGHKLPGVSGSHYIRPSMEQVVDSYFSALGINRDKP